jgi:CHAD domain-containing protein
VAKARPIPGLTEEDPFALAAANIIAVRTRELADEVAGVLDVTEIERVHDMRVATRRLRAALEVFEPCFPAKRYRSALREVKDLADALGERRDRDVTIAALEDFAEAMGAADRRGIESLVDQLRVEQAEVYEALRPSVAAERLEGLVDRLTDLVAEAAASVGREAEAMRVADRTDQPATNGAGNHA